MSTTAYFNRKKILVAANAEQTVYVTGEYFAVLASSGAFKIGIEDQPLSDWEAGLEVGNSVGSNGRRGTFRYLRIADLSGTDNIVDIVAGGGEFSDRRLTVSGAIDVQGVAGGGNAVQVEGPGGPGDPVPVDGAVALDNFISGGSFGAAAGSVTPVTFVTPAANVNGCVVRAISLGSAGTTSSIALFHGTAAPANMNDFSKIRFAVNTIAQASMAPPLPYLVPPGDGIYLIADAAGGRGDMGFDLL